MAKNNDYKGPSGTPDHFRVDFRGRQMENRWTRYRAAKLEEMGFSIWEIKALKYNRLTNPNIAQFLKEIRAEVEDIQRAHDLPSYQAAAKYRRDNWVALLDSGEIEEYDPYHRMGYWEE